MTIHPIQEAAYKAAERAQQRLLSERSEEAAQAHWRASNRFERICQMQARRG